MTTSPLESRLTRYAAGLATQGRAAAADLRAAAVDGHPIDDYQVRLAAAERHLADLLLAVTTGRDAPDAPLHLAAYAAGRTQTRDVARRWARTACRGYSWQELTAPLAGHGDFVGLAAAAIEAAAIEPERIVWAPGLDYDEARAVCGALGLDQPEPLTDIDAILAESVVAAAGGDW